MLVCWYSDYVIKHKTKAHVPKVRAVLWFWFSVSFKRSFFLRSSNHSAAAVLVIERPPSTQQIHTHIHTHTHTHTHTHSPVHSRSTSSSTDSDTDSCNLYTIMYLKELLRTNYQRVLRNKAMTILKNRQILTVNLWRTLTWQNACSL